MGLLKFISKYIIGLENCKYIRKICSKKYLKQKHLLAIRIHFRISPNQYCVNKFNMVVVASFTWSSYCWVN